MLWQKGQIVLFAQSLNSINSLAYFPNHFHLENAMLQNETNCWDSICTFFLPEELYFLC